MKQNDSIHFGVTQLFFIAACPRKLVNIVWFLCVLIDFEVEILSVRVWVFIGYFPCFFHKLVKTFLQLFLVHFINRVSISVYKTIANSWKLVVPVSHPSVKVFAPIVDPHHELIQCINNHCHQCESLITTSSSPALTFWTWGSRSWSTTTTALSETLT